MQPRFCIVKHGLRMSGMPQWGRIYSDDELWDIVSFVSMPRMTASEYAEYGGAPNAHVRAPIASGAPD